MSRASINFLILVDKFKTSTKTHIINQLITGITINYGTKINIIIKSMVLSNSNANIVAYSVAIFSRRIISFDY